MSMKKNTGSLYKSGDYGRLLWLVGPIAFQNLMSSLVVASDAFMLGRLDQTSLSSVSLAGQVSFIYSMFVISLVLGFNVLGAQYWGKKDESSVSRVITVTFRYLLMIAAFFMLISIICPEKVMQLFTPEKDLIEAGARYLRIVAPSYLLSSISQTYFAVLKVCDRAGISSLIGSLSVVLNIILNTMLIFGIGSIQGLGITGAAAATVCARLFEVVFSLIVVRKFKCPHTEIKQIIGKADPILRKDYWKYTVPLLIGFLGWGGGANMYSVIMGHLGSDAVAANAIAAIVRTLIASLCWGISAAVGIVIGGLLGNNELDEAKRLGGKYVKLSIWIGIGSGLVILCLIPIVLKTVPLSVTANDYLKGMMTMSAYYIIGNSLNATVMTGIFPAGGDTKFKMYCDLITVWCVIVPLGMIAAFLIKAPVLVVAFILTMDEFVKIPVIYKHYRKYEWVKNITN